MTTKSALSCGLLAGLLPVLAGCRSDARAWGEENSLIVVAADSLWAQVGDSVRAALAPTVRSVRSEPAFNVTHVSPLDSGWLRLRRFRQVIALGVALDSWVEPAVVEPRRTTPYMVEARDVWARGQRVTVVVLSPHQPTADVLAVLPALGARLDRLFREYAVERMYQSGANRALRDSLAAEAGFSLLLPALYRVERQDSLYVFRNWSAVGGELRRTLAVAWRPGVDTAGGSAALLAWREAVVRRYTRAQSVAAEPRSELRVASGDVVALEVRGAWSEVYEGVPMGGPFMTRVVPCPGPGRTYLVDGWLYAPGRQQYEYLIQLETLLNTFACGAGGEPAARRQS